jgi:protein gp37
MNKTTIEWVRNPDGTQGFTWNPITGCLNGCTYCYARRLANGRLRTRYLANTCTPLNDEHKHDDNPFWPRWWGETRIWEPAREHMSSGIFTCDMGELFGPWVPPSWTNKVLEVIRHKVCANHRFYLLTKQPQELQKWSPFPPNAWVGVSAWDHASFINACHYLEAVQATVKYVSLEPLLGWLVGIDVAGFAQAAGLSWLIVGAQTKPTVRVPGEWIDDIVSSAKSAGVSVFLKNSLQYLVDDEHWKFELLQEFPKAVRP